MKKTRPLDENGFPKFGFIDKLSYAAGDFGCNMSFALAGTFFTLFYTQYMGIKSEHFALILIALKIWDAINDPIMGGILDRAKPDKYGSKFRRFILGGGIGLLAAGVLCFIPLTTIWPEAAYWCKIALCVFGYLCWDLCYTIVNVPYGTLNAVISDKADERAALSTWRSLGSIFAQLPINLVLPMICYAGGDKSDANNFLGERMLPVAVICGTIGLLAFLFCSKFTVERVKVSAEVQEKERVSWLRAIATFMKNRAAVGVTLAAIFSLICFTGVSTANAVLFQAYFKNAQASGILMVAGYIPMFVCIPFITSLVRKYGKQEVSAWSMVLGIVVAIVALIIPIPPNGVGMIIFTVVTCLMSFSYGAYMLVGWALVSDVIDYNEYRFGNRNEGTIYATYSMGRKIAQGVGPSLVLFLMVAVGYDESLGAAQTEAAALGLRYLIPCIFLVGIVAMFVSLKFIYNLSKPKMEEITKELRSRRDAMDRGEEFTVSDLMKGMKDE